MRSAIIPAALVMTLAVAPTPARAAEDTAAQAQPAPATADLPPAADGAKERLAASPRHGEWVDVEMPDGPALKSVVAHGARTCAPYLLCFAT